MIIFPMCLRPAPREGRPLLVVEDAPTDLFELLRALLPEGIAGGILREGC